MNRKPFAVKEGKSDFIFHLDDFVSLAGQSQNESLFKQFVESLLDHHRHTWIKVYITLGMRP